MRPAPMTPFCRNPRAGVLVVTLLIAAVGAVEAWRVHEPRFRSLPPAERARLVRNLDRFAALDAPQRAALREIDQKLSELSAEERVLWLARMRDYRLWLERQPEPRKAQIGQADPQQRAELVGRWWAETKARRQIAGRPIEALQVSALVYQSLRRTALELRLWFAMRPRQRIHVLEQPPEAQRVAFQRLVLRDVPLSALGVEEGKKLSLGPEELHEALPRRNVIGHVPPARSRLEPVRRTADWKFLREHEPGAVDPANLRRFEEALPEWIRASFDALPAEAAIHRLKVLYRLTFPEPAEIAASEPVRVPEGPALVPAEPKASDP